MLGTLIIWASLALSLVAILSAVRWLRGGGAPSEKLFRWSYGSMTGLLAVASILLMAAILRHDFRYDYVIGYSSRDLPLVYLIAAFWGGQEGTYLLWALMGALIGLVLARRGGWQPAAVMAAYTPTVTLLISFMLHPGGNPFRLAHVVPPDGRGLNPLLQDPWMATHPPVVFLGYAAMTVPAVLAWVACWRRDEKGWVGPGLRWSLFGFVTLGTGIILGGVWAYKVLGWGGFWGWDPVENASLIPWIVGAALIHGLVVQNSTGGLKLANLALAMGGYLLVIYATFLTRSGVLADFSVHSFPKGSIYGWLLASLVLVAAVSIISLVRRREPPAEPFEMRLAWPLILTAAITLLGISALIVLVGTSWPIITSAFGRPATVATDFYNASNLPFYLVLLLALGIAPFLSWSPLPPRLWLRRLGMAAGLAVLATAAAFAAGGRGAASLALFFVACLAAASNLIRLFEVARRRFLNSGAAISHLGFALMFVGIVAGERWDQTVDVSLVQGVPASVFGRTVTFLGREPGSDPRTRWSLEIAGGGRTAMDALTYYRQDDGQIFKKPAIRRDITEDLYIAPVTIDDGAGGDGQLFVLVRHEPRPFGGAQLLFRAFEMGGGTMGGGMTVIAVVEVARGEETEMVRLPVVAEGGAMTGTPVPVALLDGTELTLKRLSVEEGAIEIAASGGGEAATDGAQPAGPVILAQASVKPLIGVLWVGTALLAAGAILAIVRRNVDRRLAPRTGSVAERSQDPRRESRGARPRQAALSDAASRPARE